MAQSNLQAMNKFPSVSSIHSMVSMGYLPPGHGYIPKKIKPDKPYGPSYISILNRTRRGPGRKWLRYALVAFCLAILFYISTALYFAHRNVQRLIVKNTEPLGACMLIMAICLTAATFRLLYQARQESNKWRSYIRFRPDGLFHVQPINDEYSPRDSTKLLTGTYGPRAVKEIPKPRYMNKSRPGSRPGGKSRAPALSPLTEGDENVTMEEDMATSHEMLVPPGFLSEKAEMREEIDGRFPSYPNPSNMYTNGRQTPSGMDRLPLSNYDRMPGMMPGRQTPGLEHMPQSNFDRMPPGGIERMPHGGIERMPPGGIERMPPGGIERMPTAGRYQPEPRMVPGSEPRMVPGSGRQTPARMTPGLDRTPPPRMVPGSQNPYSVEPRIVPGSSHATPTPRIVPGSTRDTPTPRMVPGSIRDTPTPRMVPGSTRDTPTPRMVPGSMARPAAGRPL